MILKLTSKKKNKRLVNLQFKSSIFMVIIYFFNIFLCSKRSNSMHT